MAPQWKYLKTSEVCELIGFGRTWLWHQIKAGKFPQPDRLGASVRFRSDVIAAFMEAQNAASAENSESAIRRISELGVAKRRANRVTAGQVAQQGVTQ